MKLVDYILVGQGIAGSVLFSKLQERGKKVVVYNSAPIESSSRVAAGIFNPVTGKKMVKTWIADKLWPVFTEFYQNLEKKSGQRFFYEIPQYRPFLSHQEMVQQANGDAEGYGQFLEKVITTPLLGKSIINPYGGLLIRKTGYIDVGIFLDYVKSLIIEKGYLEEKKINNSDIQIEDDHVIVGQYKSKHLIFCNGWTAENSDFFGWLPFSPVKGEVLHTSNDMGLDLLVNRGVFVLPHHDGLLRIGATYEHKTLDFVPTEDARNKLLDKFTGLIDKPTEVKNQKAGVRPSTRDRRPFVGLHPEHKTIGIFNGLGTKGLSLAPYFAEELIAFIENNSRISAEANIERYYSLYLSPK